MLLTPVAAELTQHALTKNKSHLLLFGLDAAHRLSGDRDMVPSRRPSKESSVAQYSEAADGITQGGTQEHIRWEMRLQRDPREAYSSGRAIGDPGNPAMVSIASRKNGCHRERRDGVSRRKTAGGEAAAKKGVGEIALRSNVRRAQPSAHGLRDAGQNERIHEGFSR